MEASSEFDRGRIHEKVVEHDRRLAAINGSIERNVVAMGELRDEVSNLRVDAARVATRVAVYSAMAAGAAGVLGSVIAAILIYKVTGT